MILIIIKTPYDLLGSISFDIIEEDDTQFDTDEDGVVLFDQNDNVDFNLRTLIQVSVLIYF